VQAHPELLSDEALALLEQRIATARTVGNSRAVAFFEEHLSLLRRCREVGAAAAFAEKIGVRVEELERRKAKRAVPAVFASWLATAQQAERRFLQTDDRNALATAVEAWRQILEHPAFQTAPLEFRCAVLNNAGGTFLRCYWAQGRAADLERALTFWTEALAATPPDSPDRPSILNNLGNGLRARYARSGRLEDLDAAIAAWQQALAATPPDSPDRPSRLNNLGVGLSDRYARSGRLEDLNAAIAAWEQALAATPPDSPDRPSILNNLGNGLRDRSARSGRLDDLDAAIAAYEQALDTTPPDSPDRPGYLNNLGNGLSDRYARSGRLEDLDAAIAAWEQALAATPPDSPDRPGYLTNLGNGLRARYARSGRLDDLDAAIAAWQQALDTTPPDSPDRPSRLNNLGNGLHARYARSGRLDDLDAAIAAWQQALDTTPPDSPDRPGYLNNLGNGLRDRSARSGRLDDLDAAIAAYEQALDTTPPGSPDRPGYLTNLGNGLSARYARSGRLDDLDAAIAAWQQALDTTPPDSPDRPSRLNNLGNGLRARYARSGRLEDLDAAIAAYEQALDTTPPDSPDRPSIRTNLGGGLRDRYARSGRLDDLDAAIAAYEQALDTTPPDSPARPSILTNLGGGLRDRYARSGRLEDLDAAIAAWQQALDTTPPDSPARPSILTNLGNGLSDRYARSGRLEELEEARNRYAQACQIGQTVHPESVVISSRNWGNWALQRRAWDEVIRAYAFGRQAANTLFAVQTSRVARESWLREAQGLPAGAAYAFARLDRLEEAIVALETGRARMLAEALEANRRDLERLPASGHGDLLARYQAAADRLAALQAQVDRPASASGGEAGPRRDFTAFSQEIQAARAELDAAIAAIRRVPGYEDFFLPPAFEKICQAATLDAPLVYLAATPVGGMALMVHASQTPASASEQGSAEHDASPDNDQTHRVSVVWLDDLTEARLREVISGPADDPALGGYLGAYNEWRRNPRNQAARDGWHAALDRVTRWLWDALMGPLVEHVQALGVRQVTLIPTGLLALLPLHAAWTGDASAPIGRRYALDVLTIRYAPSAVALGRSLDGATIPADGLLAVDNPDGSLVFSNHEVEAARSYFPSDRTTVLARGAATRQHVLNRLPDFPVYHFSTHGWAGWSEPLQGGVLLAGGAALTLGDILDLRLQGARLAVLSACETGIPGTKTPDEVVSIPTSLVQAGVAGVVASLWAVNDLSTAMLMERFYRLWREEGLAPVAALREAQRWLRDTTNREKAEYFKRDAPALAGFRMPEMVAVALFTDRMVQDPDARQFEHPFWWAAFCYTGA
jgi:CHAT domain-containing protein